MPPRTDHPRSLEAPSARARRASLSATRAAGVDDHHHAALQRVVAELSASLTTLRRLQWRAQLDPDCDRAVTLTRLTDSLGVCRERLASICLELAIERAKRLLGATHVGMRRVSSCATVVQRCAAKLGDLLSGLRVLSRDSDPLLSRHLRRVVEDLETAPASIEALARTMNSHARARA